MTDPAERPAPRAASDRLFDRFEVDSAEGEQDSWLMTYLDMLTLLLVMLVVLLAFSERVSRVDGRQDGTGAPAMAERSILPPLFDTPPLRARPRPPPKLDGLGDEVSVLVDDETVKLRVSNEILFASGQAALTEQGRGVIARVADAIRDGAYHVAVEGHTDDVPIATARFASNWELSTARATSVVRALLDAGIEAARLRATGYADTRPLAANDGEPARSANRRVELILEVSATATD